jgi:shikimate dehydrogenase
MIGAVNTVVNRNGELTGYNTDAPGFLRALADDLDFQPEGKRILLLGAGGACRAALAALGRRGAAWVGVANRTLARSEEMTAHFGRFFPGTTFAKLPLDWDILRPCLGEIDLLVNTTSIGLEGEAFDGFPWTHFRSQCVIYDMVYTRGGTPLLLTARENGHSAAGGQGMLAAQGEAAFLLWTGVSPPSGVMMKRISSE